jgi:TonB-dependent SusC/RagA subfamily outer membrane receptor
MNYPGYFVAATDQAGKFNLFGLDIPDSLNMIIQSLDMNGKPMDGEIEIERVFPSAVDEMPLQQAPAAVNEEIMKYLENERQFALLNRGQGSMDNIMMKEVVVRSKRFDRAIYGEPDDVYIPGNEAYTYTDIFQMMQGKLTGVNITGSGVNSSVTIRGITGIMTGSTPLFLIDGMPVNTTFTGAASQGGMASMSATAAINTTNASGMGQTVSGQSNASSSTDINFILMTINPKDVERIEVLKNAATAAIFGIRGANGVISIFTGKAGDSPENILNKGYSVVTLEGYSLIREYYPASDDPVPSGANEPDIRSLLYWNPHIKTDQQGEAEFRFKNSDSAKRHQVVVEGITDQGDLIHMKAEIGAESE